MRLRIDQLHAGGELMRCLVVLAGLVFPLSPAAAQTPLAEPSRPPPDLAAGEAAFVPFVSPQGLADRSYYLLEDGATCRANDPERTRIRTWRQKIEFTADRVLVWGELCNDVATELPIDSAGTQLRIGSGRDTVLYRNQRLTYSPLPPKLCEAGLWCPVSEP